MREGLAFVNRGGGVEVERVVVGLGPGEPGVGKALGVAGEHVLLFAEEDEFVLVDFGEGELAAFVLEGDLHGDAFAGHKAGVGVGVGPALGRGVEFVAIDGFDFGHDGEGEFEGGVGVVTQAVAVGLAGGEQEVERTGLHELHNHEGGQQ